MIKIFKNLFKGKKVQEKPKYTGLSDFFLHAPEDEQKRILTEAARKANEDQMRVFKQAQKVEA